MVDFKISNFISFFSSLMLRVVEIGRNSNNCFCYFLFEEIFSSFFYFLQNYCRNFLCGVYLIVDIYMNCIVVIFYYFIRNVVNFVS